MRRWTLYRDHVSECAMAEGATPRLEHGEDVVVMPVSEPEDVRAALVEAAAVFETLGYESHAADALAALADAR